MIDLRLPYPILYPKGINSHNLNNLFLGRHIGVQVSDGANDVVPQKYIYIIYFYDRAIIHNVIARRTDN